MYQITQCWAIFVGDTFKGIECSTSYETESVGCSGTNQTGPTGGPGIVTGGTGTTGGTGSTGDAAIDRDRCAEDGVGCDDNSEEVIEELNTIYINLLNEGESQNNVDPTLHPCIHEVVDGMLSNYTEDLKRIIMEHLGIPTNWMINVKAGTLPSTTNGVTISGTDPKTGAFVSTITINSGLEGCTKDRIFSRP